MTDLFLGIDSGTQGTKAVVVDRTGKRVPWAPRFRPCGATSDRKAKATPLKEITDSLVGLDRSSLAEPGRAGRYSEIYDRHLKLNEIMKQMYGSDITFS